MYNGGDFDGAAAFSGGGFMPSQATQNTDPIPSFLSKNRDRQTLTPLTGKQITSAFQTYDEKTNFVIDGVDVNNVKLAGRVLNIAERLTDVSFVLDDGTGLVDCNRWVHDPVDRKEMDAIKEGMYVRIHGQLKDFQGKKQVAVFGIKPVIDFDEITHHFVECMYVHSYNTKLMKQQASSSNQTHMPSSAANTQTYQTGPSNQFTRQSVADGLYAINKMVLDYLSTPGALARGEGIHEDELVAQLGLPKDKIRDALTFLVDDGKVYTALDDQHFRSTVNG